MGAIDAGTQGTLGSSSFDAPTLVEAVARLGGFVLLFVVAALAWYWWQRRAKALGGMRRLEVLDRAFLARGASVALLRVEDRRVLVGVSPEGVRLLRSFDRASAAPRTDAEGRPADRPTVAPADGSLFSKIYDGLAGSATGSGASRRGRR